jgi:hypothetical protein
MNESVEQDPRIKEMAEQIAEDPAFTQMAEQLQKTVVSPRQAAPQAAALDPQKYVATMQQLMQNPQFVAMAERLGSTLMQDPAMAAVLGGLTNPTHKEQLEARIARMKEAPRSSHESGIFTGCGRNCLGDCCLPGGGVQQRERQPGCVGVGLGRPSGLGRSCGRIGAAAAVFKD